MLVLLRWWFIVCAIGLGVLGATQFGLMSKLWEVDHTKLSFVAIAIFTVISLFLGYLTNVARKSQELVKPHLSFCWFMAEFLMGVGMLGTLIGFLLLLNSALGGGTIAGDFASMQKVIAEMSIGFATAATTTIVGLTTSLLTKLQLINLEYLIDGDA
jgi:hypothetical protein